MHLKFESLIGIEEPAKLTIKRADEGKKLYLNGMEIKNVMDYKVVLGNQEPPHVEIKFLVMELEED